MSEKEYKIKCENLFKKNTVLLNQQKIDAEQIRALQKQNGELTDELKTLRESIKDYGAGCYENGLRNGKRKLEEQLTKAKELLKRYVPYRQITDSKAYKDLAEEAEQFLKECK